MPPKMPIFSRRPATRINVLSGHTHNEQDQMFVPWSTGEKRHNITALTSIGAFLRACYRKCGIPSWTLIRKVYVFDPIKTEFDLQ